MEKILVIDTETTNGFKSPLAYDVGGVVIDKTGFIYHRFHFAVLEIITNPILMSTAYYIEKMPLYWQAVATHNMEVVPFETILKKITALIDLYDIDTISAYNFKFDDRAMQSTCKLILNNETWLNRDIKTACIWTGACNSIMKTKKFINWARKHGFVTEKGNPQTTAEICFRYITGNTDFVEEHTGEKDAEIEAHILANLLRRKQKIDFTPTANPWQAVAKAAKDNAIKEFAEDVKGILSI